LLQSNRNIAAWTLLTILIGPWAASQEAEFSLSPTPVGSGARAAGMADAFVAVADDATAASWNPAGLVQLEKPEISLVGEYNGVVDILTAEGHSEFDSRHYSDTLGINFFSAAYPLPFLVLGRNICVSLSYQKKYEFTRAINFNWKRSSKGYTDRLHMDFRQSGSLSAITPAIAFEITQRISAGIAVNLWRSTFLNENRWEQTTKQRSHSMFKGIPGFGYYRSKEYYEDFSGENVTLGVLWNPIDKWSIGLRYDSSFKGNVNYHVKDVTNQIMFSTGTFPGVSNIIHGRKHEHRHVTFPASFALGTAYRFNDRFMLSMDITRTDWNRFYVSDGQGRKFSLVDFSNMGIPWKRTHFKPTYTVRLGGEYVFLPKEPQEIMDQLWSLRGGLFYDQEPATGKNNKRHARMQHGTGKPDSFFGATLGVGLLLKQRVNIDLAYQARFGLGVNRDFIRGVKGFKEDVYQHRLLLSTVIYF